MISGDNKETVISSFNPQDKQVKQIFDTLKNQKNLKIEIWNLIRETMTLKELEQCRESLISRYFEEVDETKSDLMSYETLLKYAYATVTEESRKEEIGGKLVMRIR